MVAVLQTVELIRLPFISSPSGDRVEYIDASGNAEAIQALTGLALQPQVAGTTVVRNDDIPLASYTARTSEQASFA